MSISNTTNASKWAKFAEGYKKFCDHQTNMARKRMGV